MPGLDATVQASPALAITAASDTEPGAANGPNWRPGDRVARFTILGELGRGGMGIVLAAYDPDLDRRVAIKMLRTVPDDSSEEAESRLMREARALAKISHANVIGIHEVGRIDSTVFIAMEYASGGTLRQWCRKQRPWREIVEHFVAAARGLAAAHETGFVHRDFKPENVLLDGRGLVRVTDFGLVNAVVSAAITTDPSSSVVDRNRDLTTTGAIMGTPAYMAPEQFLGERVTAQVDQFAFCVSLWEALFGVRPFRGETFGELKVSVLSGTIVEPPESQVPTWIRRVLERGLRVVPSDRHASMQVLISLLEVDPSLRRRRRLIAAAAGAALLGTACAIFVAWPSTEAADTCPVPVEEIATVWGSSQAATLRSAFAATGHPNAAFAASDVIQRLDRYRAAWLDARVSACRDTQVKGRQSALMLDVRVACLDDRVRQLAALVQVLVTGVDRATVDKASIATSSLDRIDSCADISKLANRPPLPTDPDERHRIATLKQKLTTVHALAKIGRSKMALEQAEALEHEAASITYTPVRGELALARGDLLDIAGRTNDAEAALHDALHFAAKANDDQLVAQATVALVSVVGYYGGRPAEGLAIAAIAEGLVERAGGDDDLAGTLNISLGTVRIQSGRNEEARSAFERAAAAYSRAGDRDGLATAKNNEASALQRLNRLPEAEELVGEALKVREEVLGPQHPRVGTTLLVRGDIRSARGAHDGALEDYRRALDIVIAANGADGLEAARAQSELGNELGIVKRVNEAVQLLQTALATTRARLGPEHALVAATLENIGVAYARSDRMNEALPYFMDALALQEKILPRDDPRLAGPYQNYGSLLSDMDRCGEAIPYFEHALRIWRATSEHQVQLASALTALGRCDGKLGKREARGVLEEALKIWSVNPTADPASVALTKFTLARILVPDDRGRARKLADEAATAFKAGGVADEKNLRDVEQWLRSNP